MANLSSIEWTDATWNIARGCSKVDADCKFCYMYRDSMKGTRYNPKVVQQTKSVFNFPLKYKETKSKVWDGNPLIFTSSLTDVFHEDCDSFRQEMWDIIRQSPHLTFQILTKRPERINDRGILPPDWGDGWDNVWLGTSVGSIAGVRRIGILSSPWIKAKVKFLSLEPLHEPLILNWLKPSKFNPWMTALENIDWVIVGGESGNETGQYRYRPCKLEWIEKIVTDCKDYGVPVFVKQLGTHLAKEFNLKDRHGRDMSEWQDEWLRVREFPQVRKEETNDH